MENGGAAIEAETNEHDVAVAEAEAEVSKEIAKIDGETREAEVEASTEIAIAQSKAEEKIAEAVVEQIKETDTWRMEIASRMETLETGYREILSALTEIRSQLSTPTKSEETEPTMETPIPERLSEGSQTEGRESGEPPEREVRESRPEPRKLRKWI